MDKEILEHYVEYFNKQEGNPHPVSNQIVICGVMTEDRDKALSVMEEKGAVIRRQNYNYIEWKLNNEIWVWRYWNKSLRGYRFYKVIVDEDINDELFQYTVIHCSSYCCSMEIV